MFSDKLTKSIADSVKQITEAKYEPAEPDAEAIAKKKAREEAQRRREEKAERDADDLSKDYKPKTVAKTTQKVAGKAYGGAKQKDIEEEVEQIDETPVTKAKAPYRPGSIDPATGKTREAPKGTYAYDKAQRKKLKESFSGLIESYIDGGIKSLFENLEVVEEEASEEEFNAELKKQKDKAEGKAPQADVAAAATQGTKDMKEEVEELDETPKVDRGLSGKQKVSARAARGDNDMGLGIGNTSGGQARHREFQNVNVAKSGERKGMITKAAITKTKDEIKSRLNKEEVEELDETPKVDRGLSGKQKVSARAARGDNDMGLGIGNTSGGQARHREFQNVNVAKSGERKGMITKAAITKTKDEIKSRLNKEEVEDLEERTLTSTETAEKERIVKGMKKGIEGFKQRYGERAKEVMYATATARAKED